MTASYHSNVRFSLAEVVTGKRDLSVGTSVRFSVPSIVMGTSVRFVVLASVTFLNSISVSSVDS